MLENIKLSLQSIWAHKLRSILTMLGVIIGLAAIIAIVSLIEGSSEALKKEIVGGSNNTLELSFATKAELNSPDGSGVTGNEKMPAYMEEISDAQIDELKGIDGMKNVLVSYNAWGRMYRHNQGVDMDIRAVTPGYFDIYPTKVIEGRNLSPQDYQNSSQRVVLNDFAYQSLFPEGDGLMKMVEFNGTPFQVVGVVKLSKAFTNTYGGEDYAMAFVPSGNWPQIQGNVNPQPTISVQSEKTDDLQRVAEEASAILNASLPESDYMYGVYNMGDMDGQIEEFNQAQFFLLGGIASISLLVGGIGVMNIMLVSVTERTREIGIKKALGARRGTILMQFLTEAMVLTLLGGCIGIGAGLGIAAGLTNMMAYPFIISIPAILGGLAFSLLIGVVFGLVPAIKASKLNPIEALRYE
ncbi:ABC transporter permease [Listeria costaricensis]|uniref:ABC transporter permease n=1 Tax=Listeria costaricensis TaxID=2026604 RepID=UPI000C07BF53|nr:ABC transporter permease [Listeria costaricensis]